MKIFILAFSVCSCLTVRGINSCLSPSVPNAEPTNDLKVSYISGETVRFECNSGYGFEGTRYAVCDDGTWSLPVCKNATCTAPHVANAKPEKKLESSYAGGHTVRFVCDRNYEFEETSYAVCDDGTWRLPVCKGKKKITCRKPRVQYTEAEELKDSYDIGERVQFRCRPSYEFERQ
ncbi:complement factor H-like [Tachysurus ichikawai]